VLIDSSNTASEPGRIVGAARTPHGPTRR
jgi:hypothetical protein